MSLPNDIGRVPEGTRLSSTTAPQEGRRPTGFDPSRGGLPRLGGGITPVQWLRSIASADRHIRANARAREGEAIADWIEALIAERDAYRTQAVNRGWNWRMCEAYGRDEYQRHLENEVDQTLAVMLGRKTLEETFRDSDGSGEAGETAKTGSTEGDSAAPSGDRP